MNCFYFNQFDSVEQLFYIILDPLYETMEFDQEFSNLFAAKLEENKFQLERNSFINSANIRNNNRISRERNSTNNYNFNLNIHVVEYV
jgi:hypothetical protein